MTNQILSLALDEVTPDPEQPRQHFDREAMERLKAAISAMGQLQPIRVRRADDRWIIVDGQRRWLALYALAKQHPEDDRFKTIQAYVGGEMDEAIGSRRVVQVLSNIGEDLTPTEKAMAFDEVRRAEPELDLEQLAQRLGVPKGQVEFLQQLASAPEFLQAFGTGEGAMPMWNLIILLRLHRKLRRWDADQFRETEGAHTRVADREVKRLGERARGEAWGKRKLQAEADRVLKKMEGIEPITAKMNGLVALRRVLSKLGDLRDDERRELVAILTGELGKHGVDALNPVQSGRGTKSRA
jgi:ParB family transcriptional regulator, chromosome partitioning protein